MSKKKRMVKSRLGAPPLPAQSDLVDLLQHYEAGNFSKAEENALLITRLFPEHSFAWKVLAAIFNHSGRQNEALIANQRAVKAAPNDLEARSNLAAMLQNVGRLEEAETQLRKVLAAKPSFTQAHNNLGLILHELKRFDEAEASFLRAIGLDSNYAEAYNNLSVTLQELERLDEAVENLRRALSLNSDYAQARNNLGNLLKMQGLFEESEACYRQALASNPAYARCYNNLGVLLQESNRLEEAEVCLRQAIKLNPKFADGHNNLGLTLQELGKFEEAEKILRQVIKFNSKDIRAYKNLGTLFSKQNYHIKAQGCYEKITEIDPDLADELKDLSLHRLRDGEFGEGFDLYESRYNKKITDRLAVPPLIKAPQFNGLDLDEGIRGKHLLIITEQGVGDEVMFASVLSELCPVVKQHTETRITLTCNPRLVEIFNRSFDFLTAIPADTTNRYKELEDQVDYWIFIGSLPKFYRRNISDFEHHRPYLIAKQALIRSWENRFSELPYKINIGISWSGGRDVKSKLKRSICLAQMEPLLSRVSQKANIINLQYGDHQREIQKFSQQTGITIYNWKDCNPLNDLDNFSAQVKALDLVISVDNTTIHFSGALGIQTHVLLPLDQNWRWLGSSSNSYWYPSVMTLFRQRKDGVWKDVIESISNVFDLQYTVDKSTI